MDCGYVMDNSMRSSTHFYSGILLNLIKTDLLVLFRIWIMGFCWNLDILANSGYLVNELFILYVQAMKRVISWK